MPGEDEVMETAKEFDALTCTQQVELVTSMLSGAIEQGNMELVEATMIPLALIRNRVAMLEER